MGLGGFKHVPTRDGLPASVRHREANSVAKQRMEAMRARQQDDPVSGPERDPGGCGGHIPLGADAGVGCISGGDVIALIVG
jgi:hypothetical protein